MESICRLCLHKNLTSDMLNIYENTSVTSELNLAECLYWIFGIEVYVEDTLTKLICKKCFNVINHVSKLKNFFQTNQTILRDKQCPDDYVVQLGWCNTKEVSTNTSFKQQENITICLNTLEKLTGHPYVNLRKLENFVDGNYMKLNHTTYKKINHKRFKVCSTGDATHIITEVRSIDTIKPLPSVVKMENVSVIKNNIKHSNVDDNFELNFKSKNLIRVTPEIFKCFRQPVLEISKLDDIYIQKGYQKINDFLYKQIEPKSFPKSLCESITKNDLDNINITVPLSTFEKFSRPYVAVEKLENCFAIPKNYKKVNDGIYKKIETKHISKCECSECKSEFYKNYCSINTLIVEEK